MTVAGSVTRGPIPAFVNVRSGTAAAAVEALKAARGAFDVQLIDPKQLAESLRRAVAAGASRVVVAGGDGSIETAAAVIAGSPVELAIIPGGTLNHFARDHGIPLKLSEAVEVAATGSAHTADVGVVNKRVFINTSSVGAYVAFVRVRDRLRPYVGYHLASLLAGGRILAQLHRISVHLTVAGEDRVYQTPLLFVGVGERSLTPPEFGGRVPGGKRILHVMVVGRAREAWRWSRVYSRALRPGSRQRREGGGVGVGGGGGGGGVDERKGPVDALLVEMCRVELARQRGTAAVDGEVVPMIAPLEYRLWRDALRVVGPEGKDGE